MKRLFRALALLAYSLALAAPLAAAIDTSEVSGENKCTYAYADYPSSTDASTMASEKATAMQDAEDDYAKAYNASTCGKVNTTTKLYEKGDCNITKDSKGEPLKDSSKNPIKAKIITEIVEPLAPSVQLDENTQVIDVFAGVCCAAFTLDSENKFKQCTSTRTIYADTLINCQSDIIGNALSCSKRQWLISESGVGLLKLFVKQIYTFAAFAVGMIAVGLLVFHGVKISMSGVTGDISDSKNKIMQALAGIVLLFLSGLILYVINPDFFS